MQLKITLIIAILLGGLFVPLEASSQETFRERLRAQRENMRDGNAWQEHRNFRDQRGESTQTSGNTVSITVANLKREFTIHKPANLKPGAGAVFVLHGGEGSSEKTYNTKSMGADFRAAADARGFMVVYPTAYSSQWNDGRISTAQNPDDVQFIGAVIAYIVKNYGIDARKVFATGVSNGGMMSFNLACKTPGLFAAIAPVSANMPETLMQSCRPSQKMPVAMMSGTADLLMPYEGGKPKLAKMIERHRGEPLPDNISSAPATADFWARHNGCANAKSNDLPDLADDGTTVTKIQYAGCPRNDVILYRINGGGHGWPGSGQTKKIVGPQTGDINATNIALDFFYAHGL